MVQAEATARYIRTSAQKAGLVLALIRGRGVNHALATLKYTKKSVAKDIAKVLESAIANAQQKEGFGGDVDRLYVSECYANQGPSQKRVRPAPMGRAFRVLKRTAHLTVLVSERAEKVLPVGATGASRRPQARARQSGAKQASAPRRAAEKAKE
jgi:large subunit ribosomal protein L22